MPGQAQGFDVNAARQAGYSDDEILQHLTQSRNFDVNGALKQGYSQADIINYLASTPGQQAQPFLPSGSMATPPVPRPSLMGQPGTSAGSTMQQSLLGHQENSDPDLQRLNRSIYQNGTPMAPTPGDAFAGAALAGAPLAAGAAVPFLAKQAAQHPVITAMIGSKMVQEARQIPTVGRYIPSWAELLPFLYNPKAGEGGPLGERDATRGNVPFAGEAEEEPSLVERDATRTNIPFAGEEELSPEEAAAQARQASMPRPLRPTVGSPEDWQQYEDQIARLKQEASDAGTYSAARGKTTRKLNYQQRIERSY